MKQCPKCGTEHEKPGTYCSRKCANSRQWTSEQKQVFSDKQKAYMAREESEEHRAGRQLHFKLMHNAGIWGKDFKYAKPEDFEDIATTLEDYYVVPLNDDDLKVSDGDIWEDVDDIKY